MIEVQPTPEERLRALEDVITNAFEWSGIHRPSKVPLDSIVKVWSMLDEITSTRKKIPDPTVVLEGQRYAWREKSAKGEWHVGKCVGVVSEGIATFEYYDQFLKDYFRTVRSTVELEILPAL